MKRPTSAALAALLFLATGAALFAEQADRVLVKGTRSEGRHGILLHDGQVVTRANVGDEVATDLGILKYYGDQPEFLWLPTGWNFKNANAIPGSSDTNRLDAEMRDDG